MELPKEYELQMKELLGEDYGLYEESFRQKRVYGLRVNRTKISPLEFEKICPFKIKKIPWIDNGYYYEDTDKPAKHPYYYAGLYYLQEPSAMTPANRLPIEKDDIVLDICAAPGGKSTELGAKLNHSGLLVTNDISNSRAKALLKNIELFGIENACVLSEAPYKLAKSFPKFFDKILIDAPCSGEGMFRKEPAVMKAWTPQSNDQFSKLQREIIDYAVTMLKPGGMLLFSTCTFSPKENEETVLYLLNNHPEFHLVPIDDYKDFGRGLSITDNDTLNEDLKKCVRIWPWCMQGEGHFVACFKKDGELRKNEEQKLQVTPKAKIEKQKELNDFLKLLPDRIAKHSLLIREENVYMCSDYLGDLTGLRVMRSGLLIGEIKKNRFEPSQALALALKMEEFKNSISFSCEDDRTIRYLKGETISLKCDEKIKDGWVLIGVDGYPLGFGKAKDGVIKNKYLSGWRWQ